MMLFKYDEEDDLLFQFHSRWFTILAICGHCPKQKVIIDKTKKVKNIKSKHTHKKVLIPIRSIGLGESGRGM